VDREHHGLHNRRRIVSHVLAGHRSFLKDYDLHTIIRACAENEIIDDLLIDEMRHRLDDGHVSGKDIESIFTYGREVIEERHVQSVISWLATDKARMTMFARDMVQRGRLERMPTTKGAADVSATMERISDMLNFGVPEGTFHIEEAEPEKVMDRDAPHPNPKGELLELAASRKAKVEYSDAVRVGPPHDPEFTLVARWTENGELIEETATGRSIKEAAHAASARLLDRLPGKPVKEAKPQAASGNPKSVVMEMAAAEKTVAAFASIGMEGPSHKPRLTVSCTYLRDGKEIRTQGIGGSRKEAERNAAQLMIHLLQGS